MKFKSCIFLFQNEHCEDDRLSSDVQVCTSVVLVFDLLNFGQSHFFFVRKQPEKSSEELSMKTMNRRLFFFDMDRSFCVKLMDY